MQAIKAPSIVGAVGGIKVDQLTCVIGAELSNVNLGAASRSPELVAEIRALLLKHKVLFFRDQDITRAEHVAFTRNFGELEGHPVAGSDPDHPGLVRISREFGRDGKEARRIYRIGKFYKTADETLARNGFAPNRKPGRSLRQAAE